MSEWPEKQLSELTELIGRGISPKYCNNNGLTVINQKCIRNGRVNLTQSRLHNTILKSVPDIKLLRLNETLVNSTGVGTLGRVGLFQSKNAATVDSHVTIVRAGKSIDQLFLFYNLYSRQDEIESMGEGSTGQIELSRHRLGELLIKLPKKEVQKTIAEILSSIDDKIDLLNRQNETLEAMAQTLFRQWFIEEADESWEEAYLTDEFDLVMGQSPSGKSFNEDRNGIAMFQGNADFTFRFPKNRVYTSEPTRFAKKYDTLISVRAPVGAQNMAFEECCIGRGLSAFRHKNGLFKTYTYQKLNSLMSEIRTFNDTGTVFGSISKKDFQLIKTTRPPIDVIKNFELTAGSFEDRIHNNCDMIIKLQSMRDTLLPKLMSGEVRVKLD